MRSALRSAIAPKPKKRPPSGPAGVKWDATKKHASALLSNNDLTATRAVNNSLGPRVRATNPHSTGKRVIKIVGVFQATADWEELEVGLVTAAWDYADTGSLDYTHDATAYVILWDGYTYVGNSATGTWVALTISALSGQAMYIFVDFDAGKIWFGDGIGPSGNPEAGTGAAQTFTPNTPLYIAARLGFQTSTNTTSATLDPTYSSGSFAAWDA